MHPTQAAPRRSLIPTTVWRVLFAGVACWGAWFALGLDGRHGGIHWSMLYAFTNVQGVLVALTAVGSLLSPLWQRNRWDGRWGILRGASATASLFTLLVFALLLGGGYDHLSSLLLHMVIPLLALADWMFVGRNQTRLPWWVPLTWTVVPLVYLPFYIQEANASGSPQYDFLDPSAGDFILWVVFLLVGVVAIGYLLLGLGRVWGALVAPTLPAGPHHDPQIQGGPFPPGQPWSAQPGSQQPWQQPPWQQPPPSSFNGPPPPGPWTGHPPATGSPHLGGWPHDQTPPPHPRSGPTR